MKIEIRKITFWDEPIALPLSWISKRLAQWWVDQRFRRIGR